MFHERNSRQFASWIYITLNNDVFAIEFEDAFYRKLNIDFTYVLLSYHVYHVIIFVTISFIKHLLINFITMH